MPYMSLNPDFPCEGACTFYRCGVVNAELDFDLGHILVLHSERLPRSTTIGQGSINADHEFHARDSESIEAAIPAR
jgi:hypothetical protein